MIFTQGTSTDPTGLPSIPQSAMTGGEYVLEYQGPKFVYSFINPGTLARALSDWIDANVTGGAPVSVTGVSIDTSTGVVLVRVVANPAVPQTITDANGVTTQLSGVSQAGMNPLVILAIVAAGFTALGIGLTLITVYQVIPALGGPNGPILAPLVGLGTGFAVGVAVVIGLVIWMLMRGHPA